MKKNCWRRLWRYQCEREEDAVAVDEEGGGVVEGAGVKEVDVISEEENLPKAKYIIEVNKFGTQRR